MTRKIEFVSVSTTVDSEAEAARLSELIVGERLAACVQRAAIHSVYRWKGKMEKTGEFLLIAKTGADISDRLVAFIKKNHPYETPEIVVTPIIGGHEAYLKWVASETRGAAK